MWKKPAKNSYGIHNQPIRKANDCGKYIIRPIRDTNDCTLKWWAISARFSVKTKWRKTWQHSRIRSPCGVDKIWIGPDRITDMIRSNLDFVDAALLEGTIDDFTDEQENRNTRAKTDRDVNLLKTSLQRKMELRNVEEMPPFFFFRFYKLYISLFPRASMDTSLAAEWVTLVKSHLLTYYCSTQWNALRFRSQCQSQRWKWLRGMIAGFKQYLKCKNF